MCYIHMQHIFIYCPTLGREFQGLSMLGFIGVILNAETYKHAHQLKQCQIGSSSWLISHAVFNCAELRQRIKQCPVMVMVQDNTLNFYAVSSGLSYFTSFIGVWPKRKQILIFFFGIDYQFVSSTWNLLDCVAKSQLNSWKPVPRNPSKLFCNVLYIVSWSISLSAMVYSSKLHCF